MTHEASEVKRWLWLAREEGDKDALVRAFTTLKANTAGAGASSELLILCCEEAVALQLWPIAEACATSLSGVTAPTCALQARSLFCEALLRRHNISPLLRGEAFVDEHALCISLIVRGLTLLVSQWPQEAETLVKGLAHLWQATEPLYVRGLHRAVVDVVEFATTLFEKLMIGGGYTYVQWVVRYATCLRTVGRVTEAVIQLNNALEAAQRLGDERLQVQVLRMLTPANASRDPAVPSGAKATARSDLAPSKAPLAYVIHTTQMFLTAPYAPHAVSAPSELQTLFDFFVAVTEAGATTSAVAAAQQGSAVAKGAPTRTKGNRNGAGGGMGALEGLTIASTEVREELLSDVVLCLALCGDAPRCQQVIPFLLHSQNLRAKAFGTFARVILDCRAAGLPALQTAVDASYVRPSLARECLRCIRVLEDSLESAKMINDASERAYAVRVGCALLWTLCLPLLQEASHHHVRHTLARVVKCLAVYPGMPSAVPLQVHVEFESASAEFAEDNLSVTIQQIQQALSRGWPVEAVLASLGSDGVVQSAPTRDLGPSTSMDFPLLWLLRRAEVRLVSDPSTLNSPEEQALHSLEQSRLVSSTSKRLALLKACFNKLPPLAEPSAQNENEDASMGTAPDTTARKGGPVAKRGGARSRGASLAVAQPTLPPRRSLAELYASLLRECCRVETELGPSLIPVAKSTAEALLAMSIDTSDHYAGDYLSLQAEAALSLATVLCKEEESLREPLEKEALRPQLVASLLEAAKLSTQLCQVGYSSAWVAVNACQLYLNWRASVFASGVFSAETCGELDALYTALWQSGVDANRESSIVAEVALLVVAAHASLFLAVKNEDARVVTTGAALSGAGASVRGGTTARPFSFEELLRQIQQCGKGEPNNAHLKRALEVCCETIEKIDLPSHKSSLLLLFPALSRLCGSTPSGKGDVAMPPQAQLVVLLGRMQGPMPAEEKRAAVETQCLELLKQDPSVELCGRVALAAHALKEERVVVAVCELAHELYADGKLGWGTCFAPLSAAQNEPGVAATPQGTSLGSTAGQDGGTVSGPPASTPATGKKSMSHTNAVAPQVFVSLCPLPRESDWTWYSRVQLLQAQTYQRRVKGMHAENREKVGLRVLQLCTNAAIAATHGTAADVVDNLHGALTVYAATVSQLVASECDAAKLHPSLRMLLSPHILTPLGRFTRTIPSNIAVSHVSAARARPDATQKQEELTSAVVVVGQCFLRCCAALGMLNESVGVLEQLLRFLPTRLHKAFKVEDVRIRCQLGMSVAAVTRSARNDDPETEASVWVAVAQYTHNREQSTAAWQSAISAVAHHPHPKAEVLLSLAEHLMVTQAEKVPYADVRLILLAALDNMEGFCSTASASPDNCSPTPPPSANPVADLTRGVLQLCGVGSNEESVGGATRALTHGRRGGKSPLTLTDEAGAPGAPASSHQEHVGPRTLGEHLLALRIAYTLYVIADPYPVDPAASHTLVFKADAALVVSHYVASLWRWCVERVAATNTNALSQDGAPTSTEYPSSSEAASTEQLPSSLDGWFGFRAPSSVVRALTANLRSAEREMLVSPVVVGALFDVACYYQRSGLDTHCFLLYSWLDLCAAVAYGGDDARGESLRRASCWQVHYCAVRCGAGKLGLVYDVPPASAAHLRKVEEQLHVKQDPVTQPPLSGSSTAQAGRTHLPVECQSSLGSVADVLLYEAEAQASLGHVASAALLAERVRAWAEPRGDATLLARCHVLLAARRVVNGEALAALAHLEDLEGGSEHGVQGLLVDLSTRGLLQWYREKVMLLVYMGQLDAVSNVTTAVEAAVARIGARARQAPETLSSSLAGIAQRELLLEYASDVVSLLCREDIESCALTQRAETGFDDADNTAVRALLQQLLPHLESSAHVLHKAQSALARAHPLMRMDYSTVWTPLTLSTADAKAVLAELHAESEIVGQLLDAFNGDGVLLSSPGDAHTATITTGRVGPLPAEVRLSTAHAHMVSRLLQLRARNDMERLRLTEWVLQCYRSLSMDELGLPTTTGPRDLEQHVMQFIRDPAQSSSTTTKDSGLLRASWNTYGRDQVPDEVKNAFDHFSIPVELVVSASHLRADVSFRAALDTVSAGPSHTHCLEKLCLFQLQRLFEESVEVSDEHGMNLTAALESAVTEAWKALPQSQATEKPTKHAKVAEKSKKNARCNSASTVTAPTRPLSSVEMQLASDLRKLLSRHQHDLALDRLSFVAVCFADACALWQRPDEAAAAVEVAQSARLCGALFAGSAALFGSTPEAKLWRKLKYAQLHLAAFPTSDAFSHLREALLRHSPALGQMSTFCTLRDTSQSVAATGGASTAVSGAPSAQGTSAARLGHAERLTAHADSSVTTVGDSDDCVLQSRVVDGAVLSVVAAPLPDAFLVTLRSFDGTVRVRRTRVSLDAVRSMQDALGAVCAAQTRVALSATSSAAEREAAAATTVHFLDDLGALLAPLWVGFEDSLGSANGRQPLFLCLDSVLAPLPLEHTAPFNTLFAVQRELGAHTVHAKQVNKVSRSSATGTALLIVDPYGDSPSSLPAVCPGDGKGKFSDVLTATNGRRTFSDAFLAYRLQAGATVSSLLVDTCGSASTLLTPSLVANLRLEHLNAVVLMDRGVTDASLRRDQRRALAADAAALQLSADWMTPLLLLTRGVRSIGVSTFPAAPADLDVVAKRAAVALAAGKSALEACSAPQSKGKVDGRPKEYITLYGVSNISSKGK